MKEKTANVFLIERIILKERTNLKYFKWERIKSKHEERVAAMKKCYFYLFEAHELFDSN